MYEKNKKKHKTFIKKNIKFLYLLILILGIESLILGSSVTLTLETIGWVAVCIVSYKFSLNKDKNSNEDKEIIKNENANVDVDENENADGNADGNEKIKNFKIKDFKP
jgi:hypothetical protein